MQQYYYNYPEDSSLEDARKLLEWVTYPSPADGGGVHDVTNGPKILINDHEPIAEEGGYRILKKYDSDSNNEFEMIAIEGFTSIAHVHHQYGRSRDMYRHHPHKRILQQ